MMDLGPALTTLISATQQDTICGRTAQDEQATPNAAARLQLAEETETHTVNVRPPHAHRRPQQERSGAVLAARSLDPSH